MLESTNAEQFRKSVQAFARSIVRIELRISVEEHYCSACESTLATHLARCVAKVSSCPLAAMGRRFDLYVRAERDLKKGRWIDCAGYSIVTASGQ
ncbi:hypothetical protein GQ600_3273 [Phytophthora cactorum]|nr:hypothetical protein GQ600_3273 [Phytophthora cactorum]